MNRYKLLTPGPLKTSNSVKEEMLFDRCTWDDEYKAITQKIRKQLLEIAGASMKVYTTILMQESGSFGVEAVLNSAIGKEDKLLIISNGAYGERIVKMAKCIGINYVCYSSPYDKVLEIDEIKDILNKDKAITHLAMVHCETTTGILNPIEKIANLSKEQGKILIVDAMSSFGGIPINVQDLGIDYLISSANKCIQGVPGFCFIIGNIGEIYKEDIEKLCLIIQEYMEEK